MIEIIVVQAASAPQACRGWFSLCGAEKHAGLGGWVGAIGALLAIAATWIIARRQNRIDQKARRSQLEQYVDLIQGVINNVEVAFAPAMVAFRKFDRDALNFSIAFPSASPQVSAASDLAFTRVRDWPSVESYIQFKGYWQNTTEAYSMASQTLLYHDQEVVSSQLERLRSKVADRDNALSLLREALREARSSPV